MRVARTHGAPLGAKSRRGPRMRSRSRPGTASFGGDTIGGGSRLWRTALAHLLTGVGLIVATVGIWEAVILLTDVSDLVLPAPADVATSLVDIASESRFSGDVLTTLYEIVLGLAIGGLGGCALGVVLAKVGVLRRVIEPVLVTSQVVPKVALAPLFVIWFGFGIASKLALVVLICFFPLVVNTIAGLESIPRDYRELFRIAGASRWERFRRLELNYTLPYIYTGLRVAIVAAVVGAVVAEWIGASKGLGYLVLSSMSVYDTALTFAVLIVITVIGVALYGLVAIAQRLTIPWHESVWLKEEER